MSKTENPKDEIVVETVKVVSTPEELDKMTSDYSEQNTNQTVAEPVVVETVKEDTAKKEPITLDYILNKAEESLKEEGTAPTQEEVDKSKNFLNNFMSYIKGNDFENKCEDLSKKYNVPKKEVAKSFLSKSLGTISDLLHIGIGAIEDTASALVTLLYNIINSGVRIVCNIARGLARIVTFNQTATETV